MFFSSISLYCLRMGSCVKNILVVFSRPLLVPSLCGIVLKISVKNIFDIFSRSFFYTFSVWFLIKYLWRTFLLFSLVNFLCPHWFELPLKYQGLIFLSFFVPSLYPLCTLFVLDSYSHFLYPLWVWFLLKYQWRTFCLLSSIFGYPLFVRLLLKYLWRTFLFSLLVHFCTLFVCDCS